MTLTEFPIVSESYGESAFKVVNGVDDVTDTSHNEQTTSIWKSAQRSGLNYGTGIEGDAYLGSLANPSGTPSAAISGSGNLTGSFRYRVTFYNLSGETTATADPGSDQVTASAQSVLVSSIPTSAGNATGRKVYRSADSGSTWNLIATIPNNTDTSFVDDVPVTTGATVPGSNTTGTTGTLEPGDYHFESLTVASGQTLSIDGSNDDGHVIFRVNGDVTIDGTINADYAVSSPGSNLSGVGRDTQYPNNREMGRNYMGALFMQGAGGSARNVGTNFPFISGTGEGGKAGGTVIIIAKGTISIGGAGVITADGQQGQSTDDAGGAGGTVMLLCLGSLAQAGNIGVVGGNGNATAGSAIRCSGGGGGFIVLGSASYVNSTGTNTVSGGSEQGSAAAGSEPAQGGHNSGRGGWVPGTFGASPGSQNGTAGYVEIINGAFGSKFANL